MSPTPYIIKSQQFWAAARNILSVEFLVKVWVKGRRQIFRWGADPDYCGDISSNPIEQLRRTLQALAEVGRDDVVLAGLQMLAAPLGYEVRLVDVEIPTASIVSELLDVEEELGRFCRLYKEALPNGLDEDERAELKAQVAQVEIQVRELGEVILSGEE